MGYSFSTIHALAYTFVGMQTLYLATRFNPVYWNTAYLIVNSGSIDSENGESTDYTKIAKAIGAIRKAGIKVSLADINNSDFSFKPDRINNQILFGLKGLSNVGDDVVTDIIKNRPYASIKDFFNKVQIKKQSMISLIKGGAFDVLEPNRKFAMAWYLWQVCDKKKRITLQNMNGLMSRDLIPTDENFDMPKRIYEFTRYLKAICKYNNGYYKLDERATNFILELGMEHLFMFNEKDTLLNIKEWDKVYQIYMDVFRNWMKDNQEAILKSLNETIFKEEWDKYAKGTISAWEMESLCFYYHDHELKHLNMEKYGIVDFNSLLEEPVVERSFEKNGKTINLYKLYKICGTCIAKNKNKATVSLLTTSGVVEIKFRKEYFALFDKRISKRQEDGTKKIIEKSWFDRGNMIIVQGVRMGDSFIPKKYASSGGHQLYKIDSIDVDGNILLKDSRAQGDMEDEI